MASPTTLRIDDTTSHNNFRQWVATASGDAAAGGSITVTVTQTSGGAAPPGEANTLELRVYDDAHSTLIRTFVLDPALASQEVTFHFTDTGAAGGAARCGTVELSIYAQRTSLGTYEVESDGSPSTPGTGNHVHTATRGWARADTTLVEAISNVALGGAQAEPAEYDESLFVRLTCGAPSYVARALTVAVDNGGPSGATNSTTSAERDVTFAGVVDDRFPAAVTTVGLAVTVPNATRSGQPDWQHTTVTDDTIDVDPRLTCAWHFQKNTDGFDRDAHDPAFTMLASDVGQVAARLTSARTATGKDGLAVTLTADPANPGTTSTLNTTTATRDAEAGWTELVDVCPSGKPGGAWDCAADVTTADADSDPHLVGGTQTVTVLAPRPNIGVIVGGGVGSVAAQADHWHPGDPLLVGVGLFDNELSTLIQPDADPAPYVVIGRFRSDTGVAEYLDANYDWQTVTAAEADHHALVASPADGRIFTLTIDGAETAAWSQPYIDGFIIGAAYQAGTPYWNFVPFAVLGRANGHAGYAVDPLAFAGVGTR